MDAENSYEEQSNDFEDGGSKVNYSIVLNDPAAEKEAKESAFIGGIAEVK